MTPDRSFLPENLRPQPKAPPRPRRRTRVRAILCLAAVIALVALLSSWRIGEITVDACEGIPASAVADLQTVKGRWVPAVNLDRLRTQLERWPGVAVVEVTLHLPATIEIRTTAEEIAGSRHVGAGWRAVSPDGSPGRRLAAPEFPVMRGFGSAAREIRRGLAVGRRFAEGGMEVVAIRRITPCDYELRLAPAGRTEGILTVRVSPSVNQAEEWWIAALAEGEAPPWADLRRPERVVIGGIG